MENNRKWSRPILYSTIFHVAICTGLFLFGAALFEQAPIKNSEPVSISFFNEGGHGNSGGGPAAAPPEAAKQLTLPAPLTEKVLPAATEDTNTIPTPDSVVRESTPSSAPVSGNTDATGSNNSEAGTGTGSGSGSGTDGNGSGEGEGDGQGTGTPTPPATVEGVVVISAPMPSAINGKSGRVGIGATIGTNGRAASVWVNGSSGDSQLDERAVSTVRDRWRFIPAKTDGVAHEADVSLTIVFE